MITIAPELDGAIDAISWLNSQGVIVAIGHSAANSEATQNAIDAGAKVVTHFNNAMAKLGSTNSLQEVALKSDLYLELIYDGRHVSSQDALFIINSAKGRVLSVTDAMSAAGEPDGSYAIGNLGVDVRDGIATLSGTHTLAGSTLTMLDAFKNLVELKDFESAVHMTSLIPAQVLGINHNQYIGIKGSDVTYL
jgi:N-acetylglucosamine-6-phosphate deacetylase